MTPEAIHTNNLFGVRLIKPFLIILKVYENK